MASGRSKTCCAAVMQALGLADADMARSLPQLLACPGDWDFHEKVLSLALLCAHERSARAVLCEAGLNARLSEALVRAKADLRTGDVDAAYYDDLRLIVSKVSAQAGCVH